MTEKIDRLLPDTSVIIEGLISEKIKKKDIKVNEIIIHEAVLAELEHQANLGKAIGFLGEGITETASLTEAELDENARKIAFFLQNEKLNGKTVLIITPAGTEFICAFMGCLYAGAIAVAVQCPALSEFEKSANLIKTIAEDADIAAILSPH